MFTASVDAPAGIDVVVSPSEFTLNKGQSKTFTVQFTVNGAPGGEWAFGGLTWNNDSDQSPARSPIAVRPTLFVSPDKVDGVTDSAGDGSVDVPVTFGYTGSYSADVDGLAESVADVGNVATGGSDAYCTDVPANVFFRAATYDVDTTDPGNDDLDMQVCVGNGATCATTTGIGIGCFTASAGATSQESSNIAYPPGGAYITYIDYFAASNGTDIDYTLWTTIVDGDEGNTTVSAPSSAVTGATETITVDYGGLNTGGRYFGILYHNDGGGQIGYTFMDIVTQ
jgi:hypothetical protein